uniref:Uncharacterized protein n=1 Tax=Romanomermis culicivorax TaxID=13658 RepID=A0A915KVR3_ROMCU
MVILAFGAARAYSKGFIPGPDFAKSLAGFSGKHRKWLFFAQNAILTASHDYDRFYVLFMAKTTLNRRLTGRLLYFHLNENAPLLTDHFSKNDINILYHHLKLADTELDEATFLQWIRHIENNVLYIQMKRAEFGSTFNQRSNDRNFVVDATFYRAINLFRQDRQDATLWRQLKTTDLIKNGKYKQFFRMSKPIYNALFMAFMQNSNPVPNDKQKKFPLSKEHFLWFVYGALQYNVKKIFPIKITPIYAASDLEKLAVLEYDQTMWVTDSPPIIFGAYRSKDEVSHIETSTSSILPIDFLSNSESAIVNAIFFGSTNDINSAQFFKRRAKIGTKNGLIQFLNQI